MIVLGVPANGQPVHPVEPASEGSHQLEGHLWVFLANAGDVFLYVADPGVRLGPDHGIPLEGEQLAQFPEDRPGHVDLADYLSVSDYLKGAGFEYAEPRAKFSFRENDFSRSIFLLPYHKKFTLL